MPAAPDIQQLRGLLLEAMMRVMSSISRHGLSVFFLLSGQYLPLPYAPSSDAPRRATSALSLGSDGAASVNPIFRSNILRAASAGSFTGSNRTAPLAKRTPSAVPRSSAAAESVSVS